MNELKIKKISIKPDFSSEENTSTSKEDFDKLSHHLTTTIDSITEPFFILDSNWCFSYMNIEGEVLLGYKRKNLIGKNIWKQFPSLVGTVFEIEYKKAVKNKISVEFRGKYESSSQTFDVRAFPSENGLVVYLKDVSEILSKEVQLKLLESCVERLNDIVIITEVDSRSKYHHKIVFVNESFVSTTGYTQKEAIGKSPTILLGSKSQKKSIYSIKKAIKNSEPCFVDMNVYHKMGDFFWAELEILPIFDNMKRITHWVTVMSDISESKSADAKIKRSEESMRFILDSAKLSYWDMDANSNKFKRGIDYDRLFGYQEIQSEWNYSIFLSHVHPEDRDDVNKQCQTAIKNKSSFSVEFRCVWPDNTVHWLWSCGTMIIDFKTFRVSGITTDITERKMIEQEIKQLAFYDPLTKLPNRRLLLQKLEKAIQVSLLNSAQIAVFFIDLDKFKLLNDTLGHDKGDMLLQQVSQRISSLLRQHDTVCRWGGDEFVVILEHLSTNKKEAKVQAQGVADKILISLNKTFDLNEHKFNTSPSIGITLFENNNETADDLLKNADIAMYQAKEAGRNTSCFFTYKMQEKIYKKNSLEKELIHAIHNKQFELFYQPQVNSEDKIIGAEALIRWIHPEKGIISPFDFIPVAEETGLILPIGEWVMETACKQLIDWASDPLTENLSLAINVSISSFHQPDFVDKVIKMIDMTAVNPNKLKLELTESLVVKNMEETITKMHILKSKGLTFSLDDFGTGYSSLSYLSRMPLNQIKIDKSFIKDLPSNQNNAILTKAIINLSKSLNFEVIAEGVETREQQKYLMESDCNMYQGYLFSKPVSIEQFKKLL